MDTRTYEPAWAYLRTGWPRDTGLAWRHTHHGDELRLWLPPGFIAITVHDDRGLEALAWQEERVGPLGRTWITRPSKARYGTRIYQCRPDWQFQQTITSGVTVDTGNIPVWPTPTADGEDRWVWVDPDGVPLLSAMDPHGVPDLGHDWFEELRLTNNSNTAPVTITRDDVLRRFLSATFVQNGPEHRLTTEEIFRVYQQWQTEAKVAPVWWTDKGTLARWLNESDSYRRWAGRTPDGYRRGFDGLRYPDGTWNA